MKYIRDCPSCGKKLRFPLDQGKIRIKCLCGYNEIVDPDDIYLYEKGTFDTGKEKNRNIIFSLPANIKKLGNLINRKKIFNGLLDIKYRIYATCLTGKNSDCCFFSRFP